jgi:DNA-binding SARP family transcriptional activator
MDTQTHAPRNRPGVAIEILAGTVRLAGRPIDLTPRELELLALLAVQQRPRCPEWLAEALYSDEGSTDGRAALKVYVCRLRAKLGKDVVLTTQGYALGPAVWVDLWEEYAVLALRKTGVECLSDDDRAAVEAAAFGLLAPASECVARWAWFTTTATMVARQAEDALTELASHAYRCGCLDEAMSITERLLVLDPCNERASELLMRTLLERGDRSGAQRAFVRYRSAIYEQLDIAPSPALQAMLNSPGPNPHCPHRQIAHLRRGPSRVQSESARRPLTISS